MSRSERPGTEPSTERFPEPGPPPARSGGIYLYSHPHDWAMIGARLNPNGTWSSVWSCSLCPDICTGDNVGPIPVGYCPCRWVDDPSKPCPECGRERKAP